LVPQTVNREKGDWDNQNTERLQKTVQLTRHPKIDSSQEYVKKIHNEKGRKTKNTQKPVYPVLVT